jgi:hypothetical protein
MIDTLFFSDDVPTMLREVRLMGLEAAELALQDAETPKPVKLALRHRLAEIRKNSPPAAIMEPWPEEPRTINTAKRQCTENPEVALGNVIRFRLGKYEYQGLLSAVLPAHGGNTGLWDFLLDSWVDEDNLRIPVERTHIENETTTQHVRLHVLAPSCLMWLVAKRKEQGDGRENHDTD